MKNNKQKIIILSLLNSVVVLTWYIVTYINHEMYLFIPSAISIIMAFIFLFRNKNKLTSITYWLFFIIQFLLAILIIYYIVIDYALRGH